MSWIRRPLVLVLAVLAAAAAGAVLVVSPARAHTDFIGSDPRDGARLDEVPRELQLEFSDEMEPGLSTVALQVGGGDSTSLDLHNGATRNVLLATVPPSLAPQKRKTTAWRVTFRVVSRDGHPVTGTVQFVVRNGASPNSAEDSGEGAGSTSSEIEVVEPSDQGTSGRRETWPLVAVGVGALMLLVLAAGTVMRLVRRDTDA